MLYGVSPGITLDPFRLLPEYFLVHPVRLDPRHDANFSFSQGLSILPEKIPTVEELTAMVERKRSGIHRDKAAGGQHECVYVQTHPVVSPLLDIQRLRIVLV